MSKHDRDRVTTVALIAILFTIVATIAWYFSTEITLSSQRNQISVLEQNISDAAREVREAGGKVQLQSWVQSAQTPLNISSTKRVNYGARVNQDTRALRIFLQSFMNQGANHYPETRARFIKTICNEENPMVPDNVIASQVINSFFPQVNIEEEQLLNGFEMNRIYIESIQVLPMSNNGDAITYVGFFKYSGLDLVTDVLVANTVFLIFSCDESGNLFFYDCNLLYE